MSNVKNGLDEEHPQLTWTSKTDTNSEALKNKNIILEWSSRNNVNPLRSVWFLSLSNIPPFLDSNFLMTCWKCVLELEMALFIMAILNTFRPQASQRERQEDKQDHSIRNPSEIFLFEYA